MDEIGVDKGIVKRENKRKVDVFNRITDVLIVQVKDRFSDQSLSMVQEIMHFTHRVLRIAEEDKKIIPYDINKICTFYNADCESEEINNFNKMYSISHTNVVMTDIAPVKDIQKQMDENGKLDDDKEDEETSGMEVKDM